MRVGWGCRMVRSAVFAALCVALAALGHVLMAGTGVPWWTLVAGAGAVGATAWSFGGRERSARFVITLTLSAQAALHTGFTLVQNTWSPGTGTGFGSAGNDVRELAQQLLCGPDRILSLAEARALLSHAGLTDSLGAMAHTASGHHGGHPPGAMGRDAMSAMGHDLTGMHSWGMLAAHALAAVLSGLWLSCGERAAFRILRALTHRALGWFRLIAAPHLAAWGPSPRPGVFSQVRRPRLLHLAHARTTRGPPPAAAAVA